MRNDEFQKIVRKGDTLIIQEGNTRDYPPGRQIKFLGFDYCNHSNTEYCKGCVGQIKYENWESYKGFSSTACQREFDDPDKRNHLVIKVDILPGPEWIDDKEWEL